MAEKEGSGESEFGSVTSSQRSFLKNCPFADPHGGVKDTASDTTEVLGTPISPPVTRTPILSLSTPISLDSINDEDVFRTPPENASLSSAAESEPRPRVSSEIEPPRRGGGSESKSKSPPVSASASLAVKKLRVLETNRVPDPDEPVTEVTPPLSSPPSLAAGNVRVPGNQSDLDSSPPSATEGTEVIESGDDYEIESEIPFKEVIEAILRNSGEKLDVRDERVSYIDILKQSGLTFP